MHRGCGVAAAAALHRVHRRKPVYLQRVAAAERIFKKSASVEKNFKRILLLCAALVPILDFLVCNRIWCAFFGSSGALLKQVRGFVFVLIFLRGFVLYF